MKNELNDLIKECSIREMGLCYECIKRLSAAHEVENKGRYKSIRVNLNQAKLFTTLQKQYKTQFGVDIFQFIKLSNSAVNFDRFKEKHLTLKQKNVIKSIQKNNKKKIILSGGIAS
ncbi:conserved hypothetical protein (plasmid) [Borreliella finlandensis]|uniref:Uncharacterized protein n=1 Tax=Borreliella finlandensis TaxID=498741 RepID=A0A806CB16_9SPIR|nr:conserved hypothetical protein [Borreliella finlandensis]